MGVSDDDEKKVLSMREARQRKHDEEMKDLHEAGDAFCVDLFVWEEDSVTYDENGVAIIVGDELRGLYMSPEDAVKLGVALIKTAAKYEIMETVLGDGPEAG